MIELNHIYTYEELIEAIEGLGRQYPDILKCFCAGISHDEREIPGIMMGDSPECLIVTGGIHGRESVNPILLLRLIEEYCENWDSCSDISSKYSILFVPLVNPDGYEIALSGFEAIRNPVLRHAMKMKEIPYESWKYNARGIDINRNFPCKSYTPQGEMTDAASEYETRALIQVFKKFPQSVGYIDFHSRGKIIYYYRNAMPFMYNRRGKMMARKLQQVSDYEIGKKEEEAFTGLDGGNSVNYYSESFGKLAITIETVEDMAEFPLKVEYYAETYEEIKGIPLQFLREDKGKINL